MTGNRGGATSGAKGRMKHRAIYTASRGPSTGVAVASALIVYAVIVGLVLAAPR